MAARYLRRAPRPSPKRQPGRLERGPTTGAGAAPLPAAGVAILPRGTQACGVNQLPAGSAGKISGAEDVERASEAVLVPPRSLP